MSWGIAETAPEIEKIKAESADYLGGLNSCGEIEWGIYSQAFDFYVDLIQKAYELGKTEAKPHWIPCSDGLPKTNDPVNVTYVNHNPGNYYAEVKDKPYTATAHFHKGQWYWYSCTTQDLLDEYGTWIPDLIDKDVEILAWMPLPEPYRGVMEESKERKGIERTCRVEYHNVDGRIEEIPVCCSTCEYYVYFSGYEVLCRKYKGNQRFGYSITGDAYQKCLYKDWTWKGH